MVGFCHGRNMLGNHHHHRHPSKWSQLTPQDVSNTDTTEIQPFWAKNKNNWATCSWTWWPTWWRTKKLADMELDMVADKEVDKVADMVADHGVG